MKIFRAQKLITKLAVPLTTPLSVSLSKKSHIASATVIANGPVSAGCWSKRCYIWYRCSIGLSSSPNRTHLKSILILVHVDGVLQGAIDKVAPVLSDHGPVREYVRPAVLDEPPARASRVVRQPRLVNAPRGKQAGLHGQRLAFQIGALEPAQVAVVNLTGDEHRPGDAARVAPGVGVAAAGVAAGRRRPRLWRTEDEEAAEQQGARGEDGTACHVQFPS